MTSVRDMVERKLEGIEQAVQELRDELDNGDVDKLTASSDRISEQADELSAKFEAIATAMGDEDPEQALEADEAEVETGSKSKSKSKASG